MVDNDDGSVYSSPNQFDLDLQRELECTLGLSSDPPHRASEEGLHIPLSCMYQ